MTISIAQTPPGGPVNRLALAREALGMVRAVAVYALGARRVTGPLRALAPTPSDPRVRR